MHKCKNKKKKTLKKIKLQSNYKTYLCLAYKMLARNHVVQFISKNGLHGHEALVTLLFAIWF